MANTSLDARRGAMLWTGRRIAVLVGVVLSVGVAISQLPLLGAMAMLHPLRRAVTQAPPEMCEDATFLGAGVKLTGWRCRASGTRKGTLVYLHGIADNRTSAVGTIQRFGRRGMDVIAYDSRAHGDSDGAACTYGFFEKEDLRRVLDTATAGPIVLLGTSLGAAVALQLSADDGRVTGVVAVETFSDLRSAAVERAPFIFVSGLVTRTFRVAEQRGQFQVDAVSPEKAAASITAPVLLIHGDADVDTSPEHSRRVFAALRSPKRLMIVPGATHNRSLQPKIWDEIDHWIDDLVGQQRRLSGPL
jgi:alpha-beta hydrolase superfamily lysophospholipase